MQSPKQQSEGYYSQLQTIKAIETTLTLLKTKIGFFQKEEQRKNQSLDKIFTSSIPIIKAKILQTQIATKAKNSRTQLFQDHLEKVQEIKASRILNQSLISRNKLSIHQSKIRQSVQIRESSKKNDELRQKAKKQWAEQNKKKSDLVKAYKVQKSQRIQQFHQSKQQFFKQIKQQQKKHLQKRIQKLNKHLFEMSKQWKKQQSKLEEQQKGLNRLKKVICSLSNIKPQAFQSVISNLNIGEYTNINDDIAEKILMYVENNKNIQPKIEKHSSKTLPRLRSQPIDIKQIYGAPWTSKKIR